MNPELPPNASTPEPLFTRTATLHTEFGHLILQDPEHPDLAPGDRAGLGRDAVGVAGTGIIQLFCLGELPQPHVQIRVWSDPAPRQAHSTDDGDTNAGDTDAGDVIEAELDAQHPLIVLGSPTAAPTDIVLTLPRPGRYLVRASRRSGEPHPSPSHPDIEVSPEHWLVDLWPADQPR